MGQGPVLNPPKLPWDDSPSVFDSTLVKAMRMISSVLGGDDPTSQILGMAGGPLEVPGATAPLKKALNGLAERAKRTIKAYHGSPHDFDQFSLSKIGTGEGAQAYGHGLYFAEKEAIAKQYRDQLTQMRVGSAQRELQEAGGNVDAAIAAVRTRIDNLTALPNKGGNPERWANQIGLQEEKLSELTKIKSGGQMSSGRMYEVEIKADPDDFLDWDKPLSQQSEKVREAALKAYGDVQPVKLKNGRYAVTLVGGDQTGRVLYAIDEATPDAAMTAFRDQYSQFMTGADVYMDLQRFKDHNPAPATDALKTHGIPGIKYFDGGSRAAGEGSRNFVVFDDQTVDILRKYGLLPAAAGLGAASQDQR